MQKRRLISTWMFSTLAPVLLIAATAMPAFAQWGDLTMTFQYDGDPPKPDAIVANKDPQVCGKLKLVEESLVVNPENNGIANVIVYLYTRPGSKGPEVHPEYAKLKNEQVVLDNKNCRFEPHVATAITGQPVILKNSDPVGHNTKVDTFTNSPINPVIPAGGELKTNFTDSERLPAKVSCSIHPWMNAWLVVKDHPYVAVSDKNGKITIKNLPAGEWTFQVWQEKAGYVQDVTIDGKKPRWSRGRVDVKIEDGETTDLGTVKVQPSAFK